MNSILGFLNLTMGIGNDFDDFHTPGRPGQKEKKWWIERFQKDEKQEQKKEHESKHSDVFPLDTKRDAGW